jgi:ankyrin repeat protein
MLFRVIGLLLLGLLGLFELFTVIRLLLTIFENSSPQARSLQGRTAFRLAAGRGDGAIMQVLIDAKANINDIQQVVIKVDFVVNNSIFFLMKRSADYLCSHAAIRRLSSLQVTIPLFQQLLLAVGDGHAAVVRALVAVKANLDAKDVRRFFIPSFFTSC